MGYPLFDIILKSFESKKTALPFDFYIKASQSSLYLAVLLAPLRLPL